MIYTVAPVIYHQHLTASLRIPRAPRVPTAYTNVSPNTAALSLDLCRTAALFDSNARLITFVFNSDAQQFCIFPEHRNGAHGSVYGVFHGSNSRGRTTVRIPGLTAGTVRIDGLKFRKNSLAYGPQQGVRICNGFSRITSIGVTRS